MTDDRINHPQVEQSVPGGDSDSGEEAAVPVVRAVGRFGRECEPYILPLFPLESEQMMGRDGDGRPPINQSVSQIFGCTTSLSFDISVRSASIFAHSDTRSSRLTPIKRSNPFCLSDHVLHFLQFDICGRNESQEIDWCQRTAQTIQERVVAVQGDGLGRRGAPLAPPRLLRHGRGARGRLRRTRLRRRERPHREVPSPRRLREVHLRGQEQVRSGPAAGRA